VPDGYVAMYIQIYIIDPRIVWGGGLKMMKKLECVYGQVSLSSKVFTNFMPIVKKMYC
jgi:hypothetical protein